MTAIDDLYQVEDGVDDVVAADHNTNVLAIQFLNDTFGGQYNFGNGKDGHLKLGVISALTTTAPTVTTASGSGNLTGTFYYKYSAYNLSGETLESSASSTISVAAGSVNIQIPGTLNNTNITGFHVYRSIDNVTYYRVGTIPVDDATAGVVVNDNLPITSGTAPAGSDTTGVTATVSGTYRCKTLEVSAGQTLNVEDDSSSTGAGYLAIIANTSINVDGSIVGTGARREFLLSPCLTPGQIANSTNDFSTHRANSQGGKDLLYDDGNISATGKKIILSRETGWFGRQGIGEGSASYAGGAIILAAPEIDLSSGSIISNGSTGATDSAGGSGGLILNYTSKLTLTGAILTANGGDGSSNGGGAAIAYGGGGGIILNCADNTIGSASSTVNGGADSAGTNSTSRQSGGFGGTGASSGSVGLVISQVPNQFVMDNF